MEKIENYDELITMDLLGNKEERTLLYGETYEREVFHVYVKNKQIHTVVYFLDDELNQPHMMREIKTSFNCDYIPSKYIDPVRSDYEFCMLLKERGETIKFECYFEEIEQQQYYGFIK